MRGHGDREDGDGGEARHQDEGSVCEPGDEGVATRKPDESPVRVPHTTEHVVFAAIRDELWRAPQELDELGRELAARSSLPTPDEAGGPRRDERDEKAGEDEPEAERDGGP